MDVRPRSIDKETRRIPDIRYPHAITAANGVFQPGAAILCGKLAGANMLRAKRPLAVPVPAVARPTPTRFTPIP
jgi:hypothetical protein